MDYTNMYRGYMPTYQQQTSQGLLWVQGESGAKSYLMAPNSTVLLMDSEGSKFYLKSTDAAGMPSMRTFEYKETTANNAQAPQAADNVNMDKYITRDEFEALRAKYEELLQRVEDGNKRGKKVLVDE